MSDLYRTIGANIRLFRKKSGLKLDELALKSGISTSFLSNIEKGSRKATLLTMEKIAAALNKPLSSLLSRRLAEDYMPEDAALMLNIIQEISGKTTEEKKKILGILKHL